MGKLRDAAIGEADLIEYLDTASDFAFELRCFERLSKMGFECEHGGSYVDPVTKKNRQFDIRARKTNGPISIRCAVECKCLSESFPLLVMRVPRLSEEGFHDLIMSYPPGFVEQDRPFVPAFAKKSEAVRVTGPTSQYARGDLVGKGCAQVGKALHDGSIVANDAEVFEKWSQALASAHDLAGEAAQDGEKRGSVLLSLILPLVVVPDGQLWKVDYDAHGTRQGAPTPVERCSYYVGQSYSPGFPLGQISMTVSHLEFVTLSGLCGLMEGITDAPSSWFPEDVL